MCIALSNAFILPIIKRLKAEYPNSKTTLVHSNPLELFVATVLSAQCTDKKVNEVTRNLFMKYRTVQDYATVNISKLEADIKPTGFYKKKAQYLKASCQMMITTFNAKVPKTMLELLQLPGVARKTANIILSNAYNVVEGIAVDTHVKRLAQRLHLTQNKIPEKIERDLMAIIPRDEWRSINSLLIDHGRTICTAKKPQCHQCILNDLCPSFGTFT
jgi:endonuclease-3